MMHSAPLSQIARRHWTGPPIIMYPQTPITHATAARRTHLAIDHRQPVLGKESPTRKPAMRNMPARRPKPALSVRSTASAVPGSALEVIQPISLDPPSNHHARKSTQSCVRQRALSVKPNQQSPLWRGLKRSHYSLNLKKHVHPSLNRSSVAVRRVLQPDKVIRHRPKRGRGRTMINRRHRRDRLTKVCQEQTSGTS